MTPVSVTEKLRATLVAMKKAHAGEPGRFETACKTLMAYIGNVAGAPGEEKFRRIKLGNPAFQQRVASAHGGVEFLETLGFAADAAGEFLVLPEEKASVVVMNAAGAELNSALTNPFFGVL